MLQNGWMIALIQNPTYNKSLYLLAEVLEGLRYKFHQPAERHLNC